MITNRFWLEVIPFSHRLGCLRMRREGDFKRRKSQVSKLVIQRQKVLKVTIN